MSAPLNNGDVEHGASSRDSELGEPIREIERGLRFSHIMMMVNQTRGNQVIADNIALAELLMEKGVIDSDEFEAARARAREQVDQLEQPRVRLGDYGDKYAEDQTVEIDCASRIHLCHARCCTLNFFLTAQDLEEGVAKWDYGNPYWIRQRPDGYCVHCDPESRACAIHAQRPHVCRAFDCRQDKRIWLDFEKRIPAPLEETTPRRPVAWAKPALANPIGSARGRSETDATVTPGES